MNKSTKSLSLNQLRPIAAKVLRQAMIHKIIIVILFTATLYGLLIYKISTVSTIEPTQTQITERIEISKKLKIDQESIDKIKQLEDQNVVVQSLFDEARQNPFKE